jgi:DNA sulfur modification protein DndD
MIDDRGKKIEHLTKEIAKEEQGIVPLKPEFQTLMRTVIGFEPTKYNPKALQEELYEKRSEIGNVEHELTELGDKLGEYTKPSVRERAEEVTAEMNRLSAEQGALKKEIAGYNETIEQYKEAQKERTRDLAKLGDQASRKAKGRFDTADKLHSVFDDTVDELAFEKRDEIAKKTGKILMELTRKRELFHKTAPVEVNEEFQIRAINRDGNLLEWDLQSSSEKTILSLSFIYGLLSASEKDAPIVLDTFLGKLDPYHIDNFLELLPSFGPQIILLTTLEEFSALRAREASSFWKHISRFIFLLNDETTGLETRAKTLTSLDQSKKEMEIQVKVKKRENTKK